MWDLKLQATNEQTHKQKPKNLQTEEEGGEGSKG